MRFVIDDWWLKISLNLYSSIIKFQFWLLDQTLAFVGSGIFAEMGTSVLTIVLGSPSDDQGRLNRIAQTDQLITELSDPVKGLDFAPQAAQIADGTRKSFGASHQADIMPHYILDGLHIALDQGRIRTRLSARSRPR